MACPTVFTNITGFSHKFFRVTVVITKGGFKGGWARGHFACTGIYLSSSIYLGRFMKKHI